MMLLLLRLLLLLMMLLVLTADAADATDADAADAPDIDADDVPDDDADDAPDDDGVCRWRTTAFGANTAVRCSLQPAPACAFTWTGAGQCCCARGQEHDTRTMEQKLEAHNSLFCSELVALMMLRVARLAVLRS